MTARGDLGKRAFDIVVSAVGLVALSPALAAVAALVKRDDPSSPVLFTQERIGRDGIPFRIHKFRTMRPDAGGALVTAGRDPRVTPIGEVLRRSKLDELPQLWDVLRGRMSLVGPRPEVPGFVALWPEADRRLILSVRPGITDPASVRFRDEAELLSAAPDPERHYVEEVLPLKVAMYAEYVQRQSFWRDFRLLAATAVAVGRRSRPKRGE